MEPQRTFPGTRAARRTPAYAEVRDRVAASNDGKADIEALKVVTDGRLRFDHFIEAAGEGRRQWLARRVRASEQA